MTIVVVDPYGVTTDTVGTITETTGNTTVVKDVRKIHPCRMINDYFEQGERFSPHSAIAFTGSAYDFCVWLDHITTTDEVLLLSEMWRMAKRVDGDFTIYIPAYEGVIRMRKRARNVLLEQLPWKEGENTFVFGGASPEDRHHSNKPWFQLILEAYKNKYIPTLDVDRLIYAEGVVFRTKVLDDEEALEQKKQRRRPWGSKKFLNKRNK